MKKQERIFAPGARIVVRDAEWLVRRVDRTVTGGHKLNVTGISEIVRDKYAVFLTEIDKNIEILDPAETNLVQDRSGGFRSSLLYMESLLKKTPPTDSKLYIGHNAAMDQVPYQLDPALKALKQPRQRILISDAVGLGKTLEAGILLTELIKRGKGKRILILAVKSMLTQFQKEMWSRFTIPLTRLDSIGIQKIRSEIPTNHNPFYYYDKSIISIDTLKQNTEYRNYIENAWWDIIVIDEAHNVAQRGKGSSLRSRLAQLLSKRSDTLIMLSATPHDGRAASFASLMNMLDPTAIANPEAYGPEDIKGLYIRRFKKDIQDQVSKAFKERKISTAYCEANAIEEDLFDYFTDIRFDTLNTRSSGSMLFKLTLEKSLFSSPAACMATIDNRIKRLDKRTGDYEHDIEILTELYDRLDNIGKDEFSKYQKLIEVIKNKKTGFGWTGRDPEDRLVIFTERIETLKFLHGNLPEDLGLKENQVQILHGGISDTDQQFIVESFGKNESRVRLLIASDVASEGINLHYLSHRMIHFDIPWSLMVFQQRNGRIDRYGQEKTPRIVYLVTKSENEKIRGDMRILEILIQKDEETVKNIGDPAEFFKVYDIEEEEKITARAMEEEKTLDEIKESTAYDFDPFSLWGDEDEEPVNENDSRQGGCENSMTQEGSQKESAQGNEEDSEEKTATMLSLYRDDYTYFKKIVEYMKHQGETIPCDFYDDEKRVDIVKVPEDLKFRFRYLPAEIRPENNQLILSADKDIIQKEIKRSRKDEKAWPVIHYLWEQNPVISWATDKVISAFKRHEAPVLKLSGKLDDGESICILSGLIPNKKGHPLIHRWVGVYFKDEEFQSIEPFESVARKLNLINGAFANSEEAVDLPGLKKLLPEAVEKVKAWMSHRRDEFQQATDRKLQKKLNELKRLKGRKFEQLELKFRDSRMVDARKNREIEKGQRKIKSDFDDYQEWIEETMTTEDQPYIQVVSVIVG